MGVWTNSRSRFAIVRARLASALVVAVTLLAGPAFAQSMQQPEAFEPIDRNGVNLLSGALHGPPHTIGIGPPGQGGLSVTVRSENGGWRHDLAGMINKEPVIGEGSDYPWWYVTVPQGPTTYWQKYTNGLFNLVSGSGSLSDAGLVYTALDGTRAVFSSSLRSFEPYEARQGQIQRLEKPNGETWTFHYTAVEWQPNFTNKRLQSVTSNFGYQIHFEYLSNVWDTSWGELKKITAFNNAVDRCSPTAFSCTFSQSWPSLTFTRAGSSRTVTDALNQTTSYASTANGMMYTTPAGRTVTVTWAAYPNTGKVGTLSDGAGTWTYGYTTPPPNPPPHYFLDTYVTDPLGHQSVFRMSSSFDGPPEGRRINDPYSFRDPLLNLTTYSYETGRLISVSYPGGDGESVSYTDRGDVTAVVRMAKPGSGLANTTVTAAYGDCSTPIVCGRPTSITDARGATTDYTYDAAGNVLTETGPAPTPGAPRPQTRYAWEQRYAWYKQDGSGAITQAPSPVWLLVSQSQCMTGATC